MFLRVCQLTNPHSNGAEHHVAIRCFDGVAAGLFYAEAAAQSSQIDRAYRLMEPPEAFRKTDPLMGFSKRSGD